ncbi:MAG: GxxExxY protein [Pyrinomonadaceae bacterium]|nr:GxxExxY protein [Pyrinomonadaceae bacterium]
MNLEHPLNDPDKVFLADETYQIVGAAMEVYYKLGPGFLEPVYQEALSIEMALRNIPFIEQQRFQIEHKGQKLNREYVADFCCFRQIIVEIKALAGTTTVEWSQVINYLKVSRMRVGLLFNFGSHGRLEWKKLVL